MGGLTSPKGGETKTTTAVQQVPQYAQDAQNNLLNYGKTVLGGVLNAGTPQYTQAGINSDQSGAYDLTRYLAQGAFTNPAPSMPSWYGTNASAGVAPAASYYGAASATPNYYGAATATPNYYGAASGTLTNANAAQVTGADAQALMNPFIQSVIDPVTAQMRQAHDATSAQIGAQSAAAGSFGGSREALRQGQNDRALGEQTATTVAQLMSQGYSQAQALAQANAQMRQQTEMQNASAANNLSQFNASSSNSANATNAAAANTASQYNANSTNAANAANANAANTASQFNASSSNSANSTNAASQNARDQFLASLGLQGRSQDLSAAQMQDSLQSSDQTRKMQAIQALLGIGNAQQTTAQSYLNQPLAYLQALAGITPQNYGGTNTTTAPNTAQSPLQTLLGIGTSLGGAVLGGKL